MHEAKNRRCHDNVEFCIKLLYISEPCFATKLQNIVSLVQFLTIPRIMIRNCCYYRNSENQTLSFIFHVVFISARFWIIKHIQNLYSDVIAINDCFNCSIKHTTSYRILFEKRAHSCCIISAIIRGRTLFSLSLSFFSIRRGLFRTSVIRK